MKKVFLIIASCLIISIITLLIVTNFIFITEKISSKNPNTINIYKKSIAVLNNKSYKATDIEFYDIVDNINDLGKISIFERLISQVPVDDHITQANKDDCSDNIADVQNSNYCIEFIYEAKQDKKIYIGGNTKIITFNKLLYVLPTQSGVNQILIYYAEGTKSYEDYAPLTMEGKTQELISYINKM